MSQPDAAEELLTAAQRREFERNGVLVIDDAIDDALIDRARESFWNSLPEAVDQDDPETWCEDRYDEGLDQRPLPADIEAHERLARQAYPYARALVGPDLASPGEKPIEHCLHAKVGHLDVDHDGLLAPYPNYPRTDAGNPIDWDPNVNPHLDGRDHDYGERHKDERYLPWAVTIAVYVDRIAPRGGGFTVWPGSHEAIEAYLETHPDRDYFTLPMFEEDTNLVDALDLGHPCEVTGGPGTLVLTHCATVHCAGPNFGDRIRMACIGRLTHRDIRADDQTPIHDIWRYFDAVPA